MLRQRHVGDRRWTGNWWGRPSWATRGSAAATPRSPTFFAKVGQFDDIEVFEPREFIESGDNVVVLGWEKSKARDTGKDFACEWAHVLTVIDGKVTRWRGFFDTASRYAI